MVGGGNDYNVARQLIELHKQKRNNALNFTGFMNVATLFADCIKFVEKQYAWHRTSVLEEP